MKESILNASDTVKIPGLKDFTDREKHDWIEKEKVKTAREHKEVMSDLTEDLI
jgi:hypothetical protein